MKLSNEIIKICKEKKIPYCNNTVLAGQQVGIEDITICLRGIFIAIEFKRENEPQTFAQKVRQKTICNNYGNYYIIKNIFQFKEIIKDFGDIDV